MNASTIQFQIIARSEFTAQSMGFEAAKEVIIPIRIRYRDNNGVTMQHVEIKTLRHDTKPSLNASYTAIYAMSGVLCGSI